MEVATPFRIGEGFKPQFIKQHKEREFIAKSLPKSKVVARIDGFKLRCYRQGHQLVFWVFDEQDPDTLLYFMLCHKVKLLITDKSIAFLGRRAAFQAEVWRHGILQGLSPTFVQQVFWKFLNSRTRLVVSDGSQSDLGERFWFARVTQAFQSGLQVYMLECELQNNTTLVVESANRLTKASDAKFAYTEDQNTSGYFKRLAILKT